MPLDIDTMRAFYKNKRLVVTGAAGSVGSALSYQLARLGCAHLAMVDQFDHGLLCTSEQVKHIAPHLPITDVLCDIRDGERLDRWMRRIEPDLVIHAAALKHVHLGERHPGECILTNLVGVRNSVVAAANAGASHFMFVSTDKAAAPTSVMGASKRLAELFLQGFHMERPTPMRTRSVRFGNVLGSQGSVIPRFEAQIEAGGPLQVTHPDMERFFMSSDEAVGLILNVATLEETEAAGAAYVMDMGEPVSVLELGRDLISRSTREISVEFTGLRPGEKLKEQWYDEYESVAATPIPGVFRVTPTAADAYVTFADVAYLETIARTMETPVVRQRVFTHLDERLGRQAQATA
jgi:O-antigen biosynthesis protein WbqV